MHSQKDEMLKREKIIDPKYVSSPQLSSCGDVHVYIVGGMHRMLPWREWSGMAKGGKT